jgi:hypothetical protein
VLLVADTLKLGGTVLSAIPDMLAAQLTARYQGPAHCQVPGFQLGAWCQSFSSLPGSRAQLHASYQGSSSVPGARASAHCRVLELSYCQVPGFQLSA